jgi:hypothetical protein
VTKGTETPVMYTSKENFQPVAILYDWIGLQYSQLMLGREFC